MNKRGFTLIEALIVLMIMGIVLAAVSFSMISSRSSARDEKRKADLAAILTAVVKYRSDCGQYPATLPAGALTGNNSKPGCLSTNVYISAVPLDPQNPSKSYSYSLNATTGVQLCASLESGGSAIAGCGSCGGTCNYSITP